MNRKMLLSLLAMVTCTFAQTVDIATARAAGVGATVTTTGIITTPNFQTSNAEYGLQDNTAGIMLFHFGAPYVDLLVGDSIVVTGLIDEFNGKMEIVPAAAADIQVISQGATLPAFQVMTIAGFLAAPESYESELLRFNAVTITSGTWPASGSENLTISDDGGTSTITLRIDSDTDIPGNPEPSAPFDVRGIIGQYDSSPPHDDGYQILPRYYSDFLQGAVPPVITGVTFTPAAPVDGDPVTVTATITDDGTFTATLRYTITAGDTTDVGMTNTTGDIYTATIPGQSTGTTVYFLVSATDNESETATSAVFTYTVMPAGGTITPIYDIQYTTAPSGDSPLDGQTVTISGVVTAEFWGSSSERYLFVQDAAGPWNGILVFEYGGWDAFNFQSPSGIVHSLAEGDSVTVTGVVDEYNGMTELTSVSEFLIHGRAVDRIPPALVTPGQVMTGGTAAENYEGCLVTVQNVVVDNPDLGYGEWSAGDGSNSVRFDDKWKYYYWPEANDSLLSVTGCLEYAFNDFKIQPRLARDVVEKGAVRLQRIQQVLYSDLLKAGSDAVSDTSYMRGDTVTVEGIVTMPTGLSYAGAGVKFIFADEHGGPWGAILSYDPDSSAFPILYEGDKIRATGYISEYTTGPANMSELFITQPVNILDFGLALPVPDTVLTGDLRWPTTAEQWGNVMVAVKDVVVTNNQLQYEVFAVDDGSGETLIDDDSDSINVHFTTVGPPPVGTFIQSIRGWVYHHYGSYGDSTAYKLEPLYVGDIQFGAGPPNFAALSRTPCVPGPADAVTLTVDITDNSSVASANITYSVDGAAYQTVPMTVSSGVTWTGSLPATAVDGARVEYFLQATDDGGNQSASKTSTYPYDTTAAHFGYVTRSGSLTIADLQYTTWPQADSPFNGCEVTVTGIITGDTAQLYSGYAAYAMQSAPGPWNGIIFTGESLPLLTRGDEVSVTGIVEEYDPDWHFKWDGNTKLRDVSAVTVLSTGHSLAATTVSTADLAQEAEEVESYEGTLVTVNNVTVTALNTYDWSIQDASGVACLIDDDMATPAALAFLGGLIQNQTLTSVTGIFNYSFGTYKIQVRDMADLGQVGIDGDFEPQPLRFALYPNYPNPFNPETRIRFTIPADAVVKLLIYDVRGALVRNLVSRSLSAGQHVFNWDGLNNQGVPVGSGVYIYRIIAGDDIAHRKMLLVR